MPTFLLGLLLYISPSTIGVLNSEAITGILSIVFLITAVMPSLSIGLLYVTRNIQTLQMDDKRERLLPLASTMMFYGMGTYLFSRPNFASVPLLAILLGAITFSVLLVLVITIFWKISAHSVGLGGVLGALLGLAYRYGLQELFTPVLLLILLTGLLMSARLYLNAHTPAQVWVGLGIGVMVGGGAVWFLA